MLLDLARNTNRVCDPLLIGVGLAYGKPGIFVGACVSS